MKAEVVTLLGFGAAAIIVAFTVANSVYLRPAKPEVPPAPSIPSQPPAWSAGSWEHQADAYVTDQLAKMAIAKRLQEQPGRAWIVHVGCAAPPCPQTPGMAPNAR